MDIEILAPFQISFNLLDVEFDSTLAFAITYSFDSTIGQISGEYKRCCFYKKEWQSFISSLRKQNPKSKSAASKLINTTRETILSIYTENNRLFLQLMQNIKMYDEEERTLKNRCSNVITIPIEPDDFIHIKKNFLEFPIWCS